ITPPRVAPPGPATSRAAPRRAPGRGCGARSCCLPPGAPLGQIRSGNPSRQGKRDLGDHGAGELAGWRFAVALTHDRSVPSVTAAIGFSSGMGRVFSRHLLTRRPDVEPRAACVLDAFGLEAAARAVESKAGVLH